MKKVTEIISKFESYIISSEQYSDSKKSLEKSNQYLEYLKKTSYIL